MYRRHDRRTLVPRRGVLAVYEKEIKSLMRSRMTITPFFRWFDLWVGVYVDVPNRTLYLCPVPMFGARLRWERKP